MSKACCLTQWLLAAYMALILISGCSDSSTSTQNNTASKQDETASSDKKLDYVECNGVVHPKERFILNLGPDESILQIMVSEGDTVEKGTVLAILANETLEQKIATLEQFAFETRMESEKIELLKIEADAEKSNARQTEKQVEEELQITEKVQGYQAGREIIRLKEKLDASRYRINIFEKKIAIENQNHVHHEKRVKEQSETLTRLRDRVRNLKILAPFTGRIVRKHPHTKTAIPGELVLELWDDKTYRIKGFLWQNQVVSVHLGDSVQIFPDYYEGTGFEGTVLELPPAGIDTHDDQVARFPITVSMEKQDKDLMVGMTVSMRIHTQHSTESE